MLPRGTKLEIIGCKTFRLDLTIKILLFFHIGLCIFSHIKFTFYKNRIIYINLFSFLNLIQMKIKFALTTCRLQVVSSPFKCWREYLKWLSDPKYVPTPSELCRTKEIVTLNFSKRINIYIYIYM